MEKRDSKKSSEDTKMRSQRRRELKEVNYKAREHQPITQLAEFPIALVEIKEMVADLKLISHPINDTLKIEAFDTIMAIIDSMIEVIKREGLAGLVFDSEDNNLILAGLYLLNRTEPSGDSKERIERLRQLLKLGSDSFEIVADINQRRT